MCMWMLTLNVYAYVDAYADVYVAVYVYVDVCDDVNMYISVVYDGC